MKDVEIYRKFLKSDRWEEWRELETDQKRGVPAPPPQEPYPADGTLVDLIGPEDLTVGQLALLQAIRRRRSRREFLDAPLTLEELSFLLWATQGADQDATLAFQDWLQKRRGVPPTSAPSILRTVPSAGGRHPFETYVLVQRAGGLEPGLYRYVPLKHKLLFVSAGVELDEKVAAAFSGWVLKSAVVFVWTTVPYRTEWRYSIVSHKMIAQESGHICQNLYLACESIGAGTCAIGAYDQAKVDAVLGVDGEEEFAIYVAPVGKVTPEPYHFDH